MFSHLEAVDAVNYLKHSMCHKGKDEYYSQERFGWFNLSARMWEVCKKMVKPHYLER